MTDMAVIAEFMVDAKVPLEIFTARLDEDCAELTTEITIPKALLATALEIVRYSSLVDPRFDLITAR